VRFRLFSKADILRKRVAGFHDVRLDGMTDLLLRAQGASVLDIGCNRGMVGFEFANNGAELVHGIDNYEAGVATAREVFADMLNVRSRFEVADLTKGPQALADAFGSDYRHYDIVLFLAVDHKLQRLMEQSAINKLVEEFGKRSRRYFAYRGRTADIYESVLKQVGLKRIHYSEIAAEAFGAPAVIWERV
jgi:predicted RNA methylase